MGQLGEALKVYWSAHGLRFGPPAQEETIAAFECRHSVRLPPDIREYFSTVDGMDSVHEENRFGLDKDHFRFWPLREVERVTEYYSRTRSLKDASSFFVFADHLIDAPSFAIRLTPEPSGGNPVIMILSDRGRPKAMKVADSFSEFVGKYLGDEESRFALI
jgi:cell wall assembly regulator SMI1